MIEIAIVCGAVLLFGWIIHTLVSTARKSGSVEASLEQHLEAQRRLKDATDAGIAAHKRDDVFGGLLENDGNKRD